MTTGRISSASVSAPASSVGAQIEQPHEQRQPEDPVDDRRHAGEVGDVRPQQAVQGVSFAYSSR